jgi:hypothetical protein
MRSYAPLLARPSRGKSLTNLQDFPAWALAQ